MPTFTNPGPDGWDIPLYGIHVEPGETKTVGELSEDGSDGTMVAAPVVTPEAE